MAETDAQQWQPRAELADDVITDPRFIRGARPRRYADALRLKLGDSLQRNLVIAKNTHLRSQFPEVLHEVVCERIVIVDNEEHRPMR